MLVWFLTLAIIGIAQIVRHPASGGRKPLHAVRFLTWHVWVASNSGSVFLVVTGAEALYADLGHFGRKPIALAWHCVVFPSLLLNYLGQGALVLRDPRPMKVPFFHMVPSWLLWPLIVLGTAATVIASQALISGAYSLTMQAVQMGYVPFINIRHTSHEEHGQIYIPQINTLLALGCIALVNRIQEQRRPGKRLRDRGNPTMVATTLLLYFAARRVWKWSSIRAGLLCAILLAVEGTFLVGNSAKVMQGGWLPLAIGAVVFLQMTTWKTGATFCAKTLCKMLSLRDLITSTTALGRESGLPARVPGTAVFFCGANLKAHQFRSCTSQTQPGAS